MGGGLLEEIMFKSYNVTERYNNGTHMVHKMAFLSNPEICNLLLSLVAGGRFELPTSGL